MTVAEMLVSFLAGAAFGVGVARRGVIVYRRRWINALHLLEDAHASPDVDRVGVADLHRLPSFWRGEMEVERVRRGLAPLDDLKGMKSDDAQRVILARTHAQMRRPGT